MEQRIFFPLKKLIAIRKETPAFADVDNREFIGCDNSHLLVFARMHSFGNVLVVCNFNDQEQALPIENVTTKGFYQRGGMVDMPSGKFIDSVEGHISIPPLSFYWLASR